MTQLAWRAARNQPHRRPGRRRGCPGHPGRTSTARARCRRATPFRPPEVIREVADRAGIPLADGLVTDVEQLAADELIRQVIKDRLADRPSRITAALSDPVSLAAAALRIGDLHGCVAGASRPTADVLRAGLRIVGLTPGLRTLSSSFLMVPAAGPTLADIALAASATHLRLTGEVPVVAMLSFSTQGSASHPQCR